MFCDMVRRVCAHKVKVNYCLKKVRCVLVKCVAVSQAHVKVLNW